MNYVDTRLCLLNADHPPYTGSSKTPCRTIATTSWYNARRALSTLNTFKVSTSELGLTVRKSKLEHGLSLEILHVAVLALRWWRDVLKEWDGILLLEPCRKQFEMWPGASSIIGLGAHLGPGERPQAVWRALSCPALQGNDIITLEAVALLNVSGARRILFQAAQSIVWLTTAFSVCSALRIVPTPAHPIDP